MKRLTKGEKIRKSMIEQYKNGTRDRFETTKKANEHVRKYGQPKLKGLMVGSKNHMWNGGRNIMTNGYVRIRHNNDYVLEHRLVWEQNNGPIPNGFQVHHKDHNKENNNISNLECYSNSKHQKLDPQSRNNKGVFISR